MLCACVCVCGTGMLQFQVLCKLLELIADWAMVFYGKLN